MKKKLLTDVQSLPHSRNACTLDVRVGPFWTVVSTSKGAGIASTMSGEARPHEGIPVREAGLLHKRSPVELTEMIWSKSPPEAAVGLAAINALIGKPQGRITSEKALTILIERCKGKQVAMVGRFPFAEILRSHCGHLWVFEREHHLGPDDLSSTKMPEILPQADIVAITATTLINGTIDDVMPHVADNAWKMMLGPSTPMTSCLLDQGFDVLCGTVVDDIEGVLRAASQGGITKQITGVKRVSLWR